MGVRATSLFVFGLFALSATAWSRHDFSSVQALCDQAVADGKVAGGSVLVLHAGKVHLAHAFGYADIETQTPFTLETPVVVASISKPLLATVSHRLAARGDLDLSKPISQLIPAFETSRLESGERITRAPTVQELITHTSGIRYEKAPGGRPWFAAWTPGKTMAQVVGKYARDYPRRPGTEPRH